MMRSAKPELHRNKTLQMQTWRTTTKQEQSSPDTSGWRMWHLHQTVKQASHYYSNTGWRSVLKLQSRSSSTPHHDRDCHPAGDKTKEGCALQDSLSVLQSLASENPEDYTLRNLIQRLNSMTSRTTAVLQWIPALTGIHGNEVANQLAKE